MNWKDAKTVGAIGGFLLILLAVTCFHSVERDDAAETQEMLRQQQRTLIFLAVQTLPNQAPTNASGQFYLNRLWLDPETVDSLGVACKITGQTIDTIWNMADSTFRIEREINVSKDTIWDLREK